jgi:hypothetical protein
MEGQRNERQQTARRRSNKGGSTHQLSRGAANRRKKEQQRWQHPPTAQPREEITREVIEGAAMTNPPQIVTYLQNLKGKQGEQY